MNEILKKLLESELLTEDSKVEITEAFEAAKSKMESDMRTEVELDVRAQLVEDWTKQRDALVDAVDKEVSELVESEIQELRGDIERFRDLEVEYADKLVEEKHKLKDQLYTEIDIIVEALDEFLETCITAEVTELKEDLDVATQNHFGRKVFEAFVSEFNKSYVDDDAVQKKLEEANADLDSAKQKIEEMEQKQAEAERAQVMEEILSPLQGANREKMALILENVPTGKLSDAYEIFVGKVLKDDTAETVVEEKQTKTTVVTGEPTKKARTKRKKIKESKTETKTENADADDWMLEYAGLK